jgi:hypothetical protein
MRRIANAALDLGTLGLLVYAAWRSTVEPHRCTCPACRAALE